MSLKKSTLLILLVLVIDQISKIYIKTHFTVGDAGSVEVFSWFKILFVENPGMAWGTEIPGQYGKLFLTLFRLVAISGIGYWLYDSIKNQAPKILVIAISLIFAGALGNVIDSIFYGILFGSSTYHDVAAYMPEGGGYAPVFYGKVVDMLYFPIISWQWPDWVPMVGGKMFHFFEPVFNIADSAISVAVGLLIVFNKKAFPKK